MNYKIPVLSKNLKCSDTNNYRPAGGNQISWEKQLSNSPTGNNTGQIQKVVSIQVSGKTGNTGKPTFLAVHTTD